LYVLQDNIQDQVNLICVALLLNSNNSNLYLTLYRLSGQNFSDGFSVGLAGATPPDASDVKTQLPEVLGGCFFVDPAYRIWHRFKGRMYVHSAVGGQSVRAALTALPEKINFFRVGTFMSRQMVANEKVLACFFIVCRRKLFFPGLLRPFGCWFNQVPKD